MLSTCMPSSQSTGAAAMNGSEMTTVLAPIILMTAAVSSDQRARSVRGVGWWSMDRMAPRIQMPWLVGAISTGAPASTGTASPRQTPASANPPAIRRARSCTSPQVCRTGQFGSPVTRPFELDCAVPYMVSVNLLKVFPLARVPWVPAWATETFDGGRALRAKARYRYDRLWCGTDAECRGSDHPFKHAPSRRSDRRDRAVQTR